MNDQAGWGCDQCRQTGYSGRVGLFELIVIDENIQQAIQQRNDASQLRKLATENGMKLLRHDGLTKIDKGLTTHAEVARVSN